MLHPQNSKIILIGASTGGPGIIEKLVSLLPPDYPYPICIVQHFPAELTPSFVNRLQMFTTNKVIESYEGLVLGKGMVIVGKGGVHLGFQQKGDGSVIVHQIEAKDGKRNDFVPSVDVMMLSAIETYSPKSVLAILLSGIGDDGADGMVKITSLGGMSICQDEKSSPVFGMPGRAIERGGAIKILAPDEIAQFIILFGLS
ncbi:MAG: CheB methylesterase domain-containing protein [Sulfuricurvum sp.]|nr:CheB methylesterase domain-containing protein [Sulfuricurvum sp.]